MIATKNQENQYPAYALKSDDGENQNSETRTTYFYYMSPPQKVNPNPERPTKAKVG